MVWEKGRQLKSFGSNVYTYNAAGIRTSKTVGGIKHTYTLDGAKILREQWVEGEDIKRDIVPLYDNEDNVCGILYGDIPYYFLKNLQGDVIAITNQYGETVARYTYDAWGSCTITYDATATPTVEGGEAINIATVNPFRYRSYYFDTETGLYYLQSRYYDPALGRFVNGDDALYTIAAADIVETNSFTYCLNNPINYTDTEGTDAIWLQDKKGVAGMGHTGLMFQYRKKWYYWYWGANLFAAPARYISSILSLAGYLAMVNVGSIWLRVPERVKKAIRIMGNIPAFCKIANTTVPAQASLRFLSATETINSSNYTQEAIPLANEQYPSKYVGPIAFADKFRHHIYLRGNFSGAYSCFKNLESMKNYNLLSNNCMQTTIAGLLWGEFTCHNEDKMKALRFARNLIVPNLAYNYLVRKL